ncbi:MAG: hypothetical protein Kow0069_35290 [Promethearchaeota archaeon]
MSEQSILLLTKLQYCHVIDNNTGVVRLVEGPFRGPLESNEEVYGKIEDKLIVKEGQYAVVLNPWDPKVGDVRHGDREVRVGPTVFSLYPGEVLEEDTIFDEYVLVRDTGLLLKALKDFDDGGVQRKAGDLWIVEGPARYIPHKYARVEKRVKAISLGRDDGIYVKNALTGEIRLERGPKAVMLSPEEELYEKEYTDRELDAFGLDCDEFDATRAIPLRLLKDQAAMIMVGEEQRVEFGPKTILLGPHEKPYVMDISGSTPKRPHVLKIWFVMLGPVFSTDELGVRTRDNAVLLLRLRYKWRFRVDPQHPEKIFAVEDFIGFATETMAGIIREEAAKHNFEEFHAHAAELIKKVVFTGNKESFVFEENGFEIFGIDVKNVVPEDPEIAAQLNAAIKSNMEVYVNKIQQNAQLEAERELVQGKIEIERERGTLIELEQANARARELGAARIAAEAAIERAKGEAEATSIRERARTAAEVERVKQLAEALTSKGGEAYIRLQQVLSFVNVDKTLIVPSDSRLFVPLGSLEGRKPPTILPDET